jgi:hypothetical protein
MCDANRRAAIVCRRVVDAKKEVDRLIDLLLDLNLPGDGEFINELLEAQEKLGAVHNSAIARRKRIAA